MGELVCRRPVEYAPLRCTSTTHSPPRVCLLLLDQKGKPTASGAIVEDLRMNDSGDWTAHHFSQANPAGQGQGDVPALLRRVADTIEGLGVVEIMDLVMHNEITAEGDWPSIIVYYNTSS